MLIVMENKEPKILLENVIVIQHLIQGMDIARDSRMKIVIIISFNKHQIKEISRNVSHIKLIKKKDH
jgi:hypothetical protein